MSDELKPLTDEEFKAFQDWYRKRKEEGEKNRPPPQGDYQWEGYSFLNGGFGEYQALYFKGKKIGGLFMGDSSLAGQYHSFSEDGGVGKQCDPPVPLRPLQASFSGVCHVELERTREEDSQAEVGRGGKVL